MIDLVSLIDKTIELTPKDLMIGDWVCAGNTIDQVAEIAYDKNAQPYISIAASATLFRIPFNDGIHPLLLTDEVLEENGLETYNERLKGYNLMKFRDGTYSIEDHCLIEMKYIHQLQHALKVCAIDKKIVL